MPRVYTEVEVELDEFEDHEILDAAIDIIKSLGNCGPKPNSPLAKRVQQLARALDACGPEGGGSSRPTTAAGLSTYGDLRKLVEEHPELYRFAGSAEGVAAQVEPEFREDH